MTLTECTDCGEFFAASLGYCPECGCLATASESSEEVAGALKADPVASEHGIVEDYYEGTGADHPEGRQLRERGFKSKGKWDGPYESYYPNGQLRSKGVYESGTKCGEWVESGKDTIHPPCSSEPSQVPAIESEQEILHGDLKQSESTEQNVEAEDEPEPITHETVSAQSTVPESVPETGRRFNWVAAIAVGGALLVGFLIIRPGIEEETILEYHDNGQISRVTVYVDGVRHGPFQEYYESGRPQLLGNYRDGQVHGPVEGYAEAAGSPPVHGAMNMGENCGVWTLGSLTGGSPQIIEESLTYPPCPPGLEDGS